MFVRTIDRSRSICLLFDGGASFVAVKLLDPVLLVMVTRLFYI